MVRAIARGGHIICYALNSTDIVAQAEKVHCTSAVVTAALGRLMTASSIMGSMLKGGAQSVTLRINADGPVGTILAVADNNGNVKGYVQNSVVEFPLNDQSKLGVARAVGKKGHLYVIKDIGKGEPYVGLTPFISGEIAEDITHYFATSEQIPTACSLGVLVNPDLTVQGAGGVLLQLLPGAREGDVQVLEKNIQDLPSVSRLFSQGRTAIEVAHMALKNLDPEILEVRQVKYHCGCNRKRVERALSALGEKQLQEIVEEDGKAQICCHFCNKKYNFTGEEIISLILNISS